ncbi:glycerol kinase GlpK [Paenibacillus alkalitolerans]|uniref:glycerol kinase GlpK n=1 Tax=Paenibacillus alkalitolerans TaxID=2799335 RepID=UPI0018F34948|nr:glycerol kinase GlpK [Paenibacillus alkalitolerans]
MTMRYMLVADQSTSGTKALIVDRSGRIVARSFREHRQYYPQPGWVEHDPLEIYENVKIVLHEVLNAAGLQPGQMAALSITNQRETAVIWDKKTGRPLSNAIVWQCRRTAGMCSEYKADGIEHTVRTKTGLMLDPYFSATKYKWMLNHIEGARAKLEEGRLLAGTIDAWLIWKMTGGNVHATDYTNASRTLLFNIRSLDWDDELLDIFGMPRSLLPQIKSSDESFGVTEDPDLFAERIPICGVIGDSQAALYGQLCLQPGTAKATYGTGTSVLMNTGATPVDSANGLVTAIAWGLNGQASYALEAIIHTSGDCVKWVKENLGFAGTFEEIERLAASLPDNEGVFIVPAFFGLGAPYWDAEARAAIVGLSRASGKPHIARAALESIVYQVYDAVELMRKESGISLKELRVDGGATENRFLMQYQADMLQTDVVKSAVPELSAMGAVYIGGLGSGFWTSPEQIAELQKDIAVYKPAMKRELREKYVQGWKEAVGRVLSPSQAQPL